MARSEFTAGVERLESREVLSHAGALGAAWSLSGHGKGTLTSLVAIPNGSYETLNNLTGTTRVLGGFKATMVLDFAPDQSHVIGGHVDFVDAAGDHLLASASGAYKIPLHGATHTSATVHLVVVGGTGALAGATGAGTMSISQNVSNGNSIFSLVGKIRP